MKIKTVAVLAGGAVGSYDMGAFQAEGRISGWEFFTEGKRAEKLKKAARSMMRFIIRKYGHLRKQKGRPADRVFSYGALLGNGQHPPGCRRNTTVMSLMNGVDSEKLISDEIGASRRDLFGNKSACFP